jgi:hypothetical protein
VAHSSLRTCMPSCSLHQRCSRTHRMHGPFRGLCIAAAAGQQPDGPCCCPPGPTGWPPAVVCFLWVWTWPCIRTLLCQKTW